jgi:hypothetical protein
LYRLPQVGGGLATIHPRAPINADYSDFINDTPPLSIGHQGLTVPPTWSGGPGHRKGTEFSKLPGSAHLSVFSNWSGGLEHRKGMESSKLPDPSPLFYAINPDNLSGLEPFQEGRTLDSSDEEEGWIAKSSSLDHEVFVVFTEEIPFMEADASDRVYGRTAQINLP